MMFIPPQPAGKRWPALLFSMAAHTLVVGAMVWSALPRFVTPSSIRKGERGTSLELVYLTSKDLAAALHSSAPAPQDQAIYAPASKAMRPKPKAAKSRKDPPQAVSAELAAPPAGAPYGSLLEGPLDGHEVKPAIPVVFPSPSVFPWQLPQGVTGDVIVEVTISAQGDVVDTKLLQAIGYGIDDRVVATVRSWRFRPATRDGVAIPSQHDVHFHFPS